MCSKVSILPFFTMAKALLSIAAPFLRVQATVGIKMVYCRLVVKGAALKGEIAVFREGGLSGARVGLAGVVKREDVDTAMP